MTQYSDFHKLIWICGIIGALGGAGGLFIGAVKWMTAVWKKTTEIITHIDGIPVLIDSQSKAAINLAQVKKTVDIIQTNHLAHLEVGIGEVVRTNLELVELTRDVRDGIIKLVDRSERV